MYLQRRLYCEQCNDDVNIIWEYGTGGFLTMDKTGVYTIGFKCSNEPCVDCINRTCHVLEELEEEFNK